MVNVNELKAQIVRHGLKSKDVYSAIGMPKKSWYDRLSNPNMFKASEIHEIAALLDVSMDIFFTDEDT